MKIGRSGTLAKKPCQCLNSDGFELNHLRDELIMIDCINVGAYNPEENLLRKHKLLPIPTHAHENYAYTATQSLCHTLHHNPLKSSSIKFEPHAHVIIMHGHLANSFPVL